MQRYIAGSGGDDTAFVQTMFDSLVQGDGLQMSGVFNVSAPLNIGNGSSLAASSRQCFTIEGTARAGIYNDGREGSGGCVINYTGPVTTSAVINVRGPILGLTLRNLKVQCNGRAATGVNLTHIQRSTVENLHVTGYTGVAYIIDAYSSVVGVWNGAGDNTVSGLACTGPGHAQAGGIIIGSAVEPVYPYLDVCRLLMNQCWFTAGAQGDAFKLRYMDNCTFMCVHTYQGTALVIETNQTFPTFPCETTFINCGFHGPYRISPTWNPAGKLFFFPFPMSDGGQPPEHQGIVGLTSHGNWFGFQTAQRES